MHLKNTPWSYSDIKLLKAAWRKRMQRKATTSQLAAELDIPKQWLCILWKRYGMNPLIEHRRDHSTGKRDKLVHEMRQAGLTYDECCLHLGMRPTKVNYNKLRNSHIRFCVRNEFSYPRPRLVQAEALMDKVLALKQAGVSYRQICIRLSLPEEKKKSLPSRLKGHCKKREVIWPIEVGES